jgi:hypothetical protein
VWKSFLEKDYGFYDGDFGERVVEDGFGCMEEVGY